MATRAQIESAQRYNKEHTMQKAFRLNNNTEKRLIAWLADKPFTTYVKSLIADDMVRNGMELDERLKSCAMKS